MLPNLGSEFTARTFRPVFSVDSELSAPVAWSYMTRRAAKAEVPKAERNLDAARRELRLLRRRIRDLTILHENTTEHNSAIENELAAKNAELERLLGAMRRYLPPQLYDAILGGRTQANLSAHARKKLTVFFSDIVDFTRITDQLESEVLSELLNSYLREMSNIALEYRGTIDKFIGDAIMIFFGDPEYIDDQTHALDAVLMALDMQHRIRELERYWIQKGAHRGLHVRMGINTGYCTVGNFGTEERMEYTAIGAQVNIASRLEQLAGSGSIVISGATCALVEDMVDVRSLGPVEMKGIHYPVEAFYVLGLKNRRRVSDHFVQTADGFELKEMRVKVKEMNALERQELLRALGLASDQLRAADGASTINPELAD